MNDVLAIATVTLAGGGRIGVCRLPGLGGRLAADLRTIAGWRPGIVISMTGRAEMDRHGGAGLGPLLAGAAIEWRHFPVRDFGGPGREGRAAWPALAARLHDTLDGGGGVLLHCRGGQGRSGMVALRLLVERGEEVEAALARLRAVRPGAVETDAQLEWASQGAAELRRGRAGAPAGSPPPSAPGSRSSG